MMEIYIQEIGKKDNVMDMVLSNGKVDKHTQDAIEMIKKMVTE